MRALATAVFVILSGCALTSKAPPVEIRYFSPEALGAPVRTAPKDQNLTPVGLRVGRVTSSAHLRHRMVYRRSDFELGTYETLRWTENPEEYMRRALARSLFEQRPLVQADGRQLPVLDVELVTFEEVRRGASRAGRVQIRYVLHDAKGVLARDMVTLEREAAAPGRVDDIVAAIAAALDEATSQLADAVAEHLLVPPRPD